MYIYKAIDLQFVTELLRDGVMPSFVVAKLRCCAQPPHGCCLFHACKVTHAHDRFRMLPKSRKLAIVGEGRHLSWAANVLAIYTIYIEWWIGSCLNLYESHFCCVSCFIDLFFEIFYLFGGATGIEFLSVSVFLLWGGFVLFSGNLLVGAYLANNCSLFHKTWFGIPAWSKQSQVHPLPRFFIYLYDIGWRLWKL